KIPTHIIKALGGGLQIYPEKRTQTIDAFREQLSVAPTVVAAAAQKQEIPEKDPVEEEEFYRGYPGYDAPKPKSNTGKVVIAILVILIIAAAIAGAYIVKNGGINKPEEDTTAPVSTATYTVPDFVSSGYTQSDIQNNGAWNNQFTISFTSDYSKDVAEGVVFKQSIDAGETVNEKTEIVLTVSKGIKTEVLPDVGGMSVEEATKELEKLGFTVSTVEIYNNGGNTPDTVKSRYGMAPGAGEEVAVGEEIILQVYGEVVTTTTQPDDDTNE
ncbi:MAG: PASTA domain-containing protein, partial [Eubacterium sp.]|nr:PASTA domain-containing protein [Eubacterium sp.]